MAATTIASGNKVTQWTRDFIQEYVRDSLFAPYMGTTENDIFQLKKDLTKKKGNTISVPLVGKVGGAGVTGDNTLEGNEQALNNWNHDVTVDQIRQAVLVGGMEARSTQIDVLEAAKLGLKMWIMDNLRDAQLQALGSPNIDGVTAYAATSEADRDAWCAANNPTSTDQRILFGSVSSNSSGDHSADLAKVDSTNDKLDFDIVQLAKRKAKKVGSSTRAIRPVRVKGGREFFVMFSESYGFRDLKVDTESIHQNAGVRGKDNPLFQDPDLMLDGVIVREVPEIDAITGVGASGIDVGQHYLCGAQAVAVAYAQMTKFVIKRDFDYENQVGVAIGEIRGVEKMSHNSIQNGVLTVYASGVADS